MMIKGARRSEWHRRGLLEHVTAYKGLKVLIRFLPGKGGEELPQAEAKIS